MSRKERLKVYHGIPKSVPDSNTLFYCDYDGSIIPKVDNMFMISSNPTTVKYSSTPTGYGMKVDENISDKALNFILPKALTLDLWVNCAELNTSGNILTFADTTTGLRKVFMSVLKNSVAILLFGDDGNGTTASSPTNSIVLYSTPTSGYHHFRLTIDLLNKVGSIYQDGVLKITKTVNGGNFVGHSTKVRLFSGCGNNNDDMYYFRNTTISDLHISNIDRGDYFPNLPQDFIDGKAIIQPKIGQQQIKGDPMYSQVTKLLVPNNKENTGNYSTVANADGRFTHNLYPELSCLGASTWASGTSLKITALNGEIISGVIDSNTALCKVVKPTVSAVAVNKATFYVDDTSKLSVGDTVRTVKADFSFIGGKEYTIESIVPNESFVGVLDTTSTINVTEDFLFFETTVTSSSPVVKTINNNTVEGTWTGLGTNEAIFTVGTNTSALVEGKDLVVTYSLNTKAGNSDFTELPYAINKVYDEVGNQLVEVTEIIIEDDFKSKVVGDTKICPHISGYAQGKVIPTPTDFTEISQDKYTAMESADDIFSYITGSGGSTDIPYQLFSFNVAEMIYRKVGFKYLYLGSEVRDLIESVKIYWKGVSSSTTKPTCALYNYLSSSSGWQSLGTHANTSNTAIESSVDVSSIDTKGFMYFCASQSDTSGSIKTDYVKITIKLKKTANYSCFYVDNVRAREFPCNPVLVQKETKTFTRLIPSDKCFSTEYSSYGVNPKLTTDVSTASHVFSSDKMFVTTEGTGAYDSNLIRSGSKNVLARLGVPTLLPYLYTPTALVSKQPWNNNVSAILPYKYVLATNTLYAPFNLYNMPQEDLPMGRTITLTKYLDKVNEELYLKVLIQEHLNGVYQSYKIASYKVPNRPLIK